MMTWSFCLEVFTFLPPFLLPLLLLFLFPFCLQYIFFNFFVRFMNFFFPLLNCHLCLPLFFNFPIVSFLMHCRFPPLLPMTPPPITRTDKLPGNRLIVAETSGQRLESVIRDDGVARFEVTAPTGAESFTIRAKYDDDDSIAAQITPIKHFSTKNQFLHLTTSTIDPAVGM